MARFKTDRGSRCDIQSLAARGLLIDAQTGVICTLAPSHMYYADSRITLSFAANACKVKVKARVNEVKKEDSELGIFQDVAQKLKAQGVRARGARCKAQGARREAQGMKNKDKATERLQQPR